MRRKRAAIGYRILRVSHFLRVVSRRGASAGAGLSRVPLGTARKPPPARAERNPRESSGLYPRSRTLAKEVARGAGIQEGASSGSLGWVLSGVMSVLIQGS